MAKTCPCSYVLPLIPSRNRIAIWFSWRSIQAWVLKLGLAAGSARGSRRRLSTPAETSAPARAEELIPGARERLTTDLCARSIDFERTLPRLPSDKLDKRLLEDRS
jgi:hypothetical protein